MNKDGQSPSRSVVRDRTASEYDRVPYPDRAYRDTHPDHLAVVGTLFGMKPPAVESCRVLEVGCSGGGNLIPMAVSLPRSEFFGIDLAGEPINSAQRVIEQAQIRNARVQATNLLDVMEDFGKFDYIIAHGFYSWVPQQVQEKLFAVCRDNLNPGGIAFISYNTYPAGHVRNMTRDMFRFHTHTEDGIDQVTKGKDFLQLVVNAVDPKATWKSIINSEIERLNTRDNHVTYHDELSLFYSPTYVSDFIKSAQRYDLQFVSEAKLHDVINPGLKPDVLQQAKMFADGDEIRYQQYLDFLLFRGFRGTLLCHREIPLERDELTKHVTKLWLASPLKQSKTKANGAIEFANSRGPGTVTTDNIILKTLLQHLQGIWPHAEPFESILEALLTKISSEPRDNVSSAIKQAALALASNKLMDLRTYRVPIAKRIDEYPVVSPLTRFQAAEGKAVTTLLHSEIDIKDARTLEILRHLDGTHRIADLNVGYEPSTVEEVRRIINGFYETGLLME